MLSLVNLRMIAYNLHFQAFLFFFVIWWACRFSLFLSFVFAFVSWCSSSRDSTIICFCVSLLFFLWWIHPAFSLAFFAGYAYFYYLCLTEEIARNSNGWQYLTDNPPVATSASGMLAHRACSTVSDMLQRSSDLVSIDTLQRWFDQWCPFGLRSDSDDSSQFNDAGLSLLSSTSSSDLRSDDIFPPVPDDISSKLVSVCNAMEGLNISDSSHVSLPLSIVDRDDPSWLSNVNGVNSFPVSRCTCQGSTDYGVCFCLRHVCTGTVCACGNGRGGGARGLSFSVSGGSSSGMAPLFGTSWNIPNAGSSFWNMLLDVQQKLASLSLGSSLDTLVSGSPLLDPRVQDTVDDASAEPSSSGGNSPSGSEAGDVLSSMTTSLLTLTDRDSSAPVNDAGGNDATVDDNDDDDGSILAAIGFDKLRVGNTFSATPYLIIANNSDDSDDSSCASNEEDHVISGGHNHMFGGNSL